MKATLKTKPPKTSKTARPLSH